jgi:hypothetical protein
MLQMSQECSCAVTEQTFPVFYVSYDSLTNGRLVMGVGNKNRKTAPQQSCEHLNMPPGRCTHAGSVVNPKAAHSVWHAAATFAYDSNE